MDDDVIFDYSKLLGKIKEKFNTIENYSRIFPKGRTTLSKSLNNGRQFNQSEIIFMTKTLGVKLNEIPLYFFAVKVQKNEQKTA